MIAERYIVDVLRESTTLNVLQSRLHGLDHWFRVWKNAQILAKHTPNVDMEVVAIYALFHDSMRNDDDYDPQHGFRGWLLWQYLDEASGVLLTEQQYHQLSTACAEHSDGTRSLDPTIGVCWDADRLDLHRKGIWPDIRFMSTQATLDLARRRIHPNL